MNTLFLLPIMAAQLIAPSIRLTVPIPPEPVWREMTVTMFTSTPEQTDSTPCIAARNVDICERWLNGESLCASNDYPLGTHIFIDSNIQGTCLVIDRMNRRYKNRIDWYNGFDKDCLDGYQPGDDCPRYREAKRFGKQKANVMSSE